MKKWNRLYFGFTVAWVSVVLLWQLNWSHPDASAWVQAVGTIIAIVATWLLTRSQNINAEKLLETERADEARLQAKYLAESDILKTKHLLTMFKPLMEITSNLVKKDDDGDDFVAHINLQYFERLQRRLANLDFMLLPCSEQAAHVMRLSDFLDTFLYYAKPALEFNWRMRQPVNSINPADEIRYNQQEAGARNKMRDLMAFSNAAVSECEDFIRKLEAKVSQVKPAVKDM